MKKWSVASLYNQIQSLILHPNLCASHKNCCTSQSSFQSLSLSSLRLHHFIFLHFLIKKKKDLLSVLCSFMLLYVTTENHSVCFSSAVLYPGLWYPVTKTHVTHMFKMLIHFFICLFDILLCRFQNTKTKKI